MPSRLGAGGAARVGNKLISVRCDPVRRRCECVPLDGRTVHRRRVGSDARLRFPRYIGTLYPLYGETPKDANGFWTMDGGACGYAAAQVRRAAQDVIGCMPRCAVHGGRMQTRVRWFRCAAALCPVDGRGVFARLV